MVTAIGWRLYYDDSATKMLVSCYFKHLLPVNIFGSLTILVIQRCPYSQPPPPSQVKQTMDFVSALMVLQTADEKELQFHGIQTILTLRQVGQRLQAHILPDDNELSTGESEVEGIFSASANFSSSGSSRHSSPATSISKDASNEGPQNGYLGGVDHLPGSQSSVRPSLLSIDNTTRKTRKVSSKAETLLKAITKKVPSIWSMKEDNVIDLISRKRSSTTDRRIEDITLVEGDTEAECNDKLLRVSALLSYASEFESYQRRHDLPSRVDSVVQLLLSGCSDPKSLHERKGSLIAKYVKGVSRFKGRESFICRATGNGVKFAVVKKLLEARLEDRGLPNECHAILPVLGLISHRLFSTTYQHLLELVDLLLSDQALVTLPSDGSNEGDGVASSQRHILDVIREVSPWSKGFQNHYECWCTPKAQRLPI